MSSTPSLLPHQNTLASFAAVEAPVRKGREDSKKSRTGKKGKARQVEPSQPQLEEPQLDQPASPKPREEKVLPKRTLNWAAIIWLGLIHAGCIFAPFYFSWQAVVLVVVLHWLTGGIGICLGFHRMLTHTSFATYRPVRLFIAMLGGLAGEGSVLDWVANHRKHHAHSDQEGDPHSPRDGGLWSHIFWMAYQHPTYTHISHLRRWAPDLVKDHSMRWIARLFLPSQFVLAAILYAFGFLVGGWYMAASFVVYGMFIRLVGVMHSTWFVNSASHIWGYKNYETSDDSRNNWWVALVTYGEGWHNNHHAYPRMAPHGHRWWEVDMTFMAIRAMQAVGLAWDVVDYKKKSEAK